jgi:hypothetical protein
MRNAMSAGSCGKAGGGQRGRAWGGTLCARALNGGDASSPANMMGEVDEVLELIGEPRLDVSGNSVSALAGGVPRTVVRSIWCAGSVVTRRDGRA